MTRKDLELDKKIHKAISIMQFKAGGSGDQTASGISDWMSSTASCIESIMIRRDCADR